MHVILLLKSRLVLLAATWKCKLQKRVWRTFGPSFAAFFKLLAHRLNVTSRGLFYKFYFGRCSSELGSLLVFLKDCMIFLSPFLDDTRMSMQWCNLILARRFWATKVCLRAIEISRICLFRRPTGRATFWKANFENYSRSFLRKWHQFLSIYYSISNTSFRFRHRFLLAAHSSESHATSC